MITQATAAAIWECYREIAAGEQLLADMQKNREQYDRGDCFEPRLKDAFGRRRKLQLGVPSGETSHTLYGVSAKLGESVINAHIAGRRAELIELNERARIELDTETVPSPSAEK